jgi:hypothetical protein
MVGAAEAALGRNLDYAAALIDKALTLDPNSAGRGFAAAIAMSIAATTRWRCSISSAPRS